MQVTFKGRWICTEEFACLQPRDMYHKEHEPARYIPQENDPQNVHTLFRRDFTLRKIPGSYILRISADDYAKYYVNGQFIGQGPTPDYLENYQYNEFDITKYLRDGENVIMAHVYYQGLVNRVWISGDLRMGLIADLIAPDGQTLLYTDNSWEYAPIKNFLPGHTFGYKTQFAENYDSRLPLGQFRTARVRDEHGIRFASKPARPIFVQRRSPVASQRLPNGGWFYDFGQEITAALRIRARGQDGDTIRILCGEETDDSPEQVRYQMRCNCRYEEHWTLGCGEYLFEQFNHKTFRYVALIPSSADVQVTELTALMGHAAIDGSIYALE